MKRNVAAMLASPRCGAITRVGKPCKLAQIKGRPRCRLHGGATGSGAPIGNRNRFKHGVYTAVEKERRRKLRAVLRVMREALG